jgi:predicted LPLAT superfamily acyltransferase
MSARPLWLDQQERGSRHLMRTIAAIALGIGRPAGRLLLYPISAYFVLFSKRARQASREYLWRVLGRRPGWRDVFRHYHCFAATILDRVFLLSGRFRHFKYTVEGLDELLATMASGRGCLLVGAHFGSFEVLRVMAQAEAPVRLRVLMHPQNAAKINSVLGALNPAVVRDMITLGRPQTMLEVRDAVDAGEIVGMLADRVVAGDRLAACDFLGGTAHFPLGPFLLAELLQAPVIMFSAACRGDGCYSIRFTPVPTTACNPHDKSALASKCQNFAHWLEGRCRDDPYNWFNFYDFWAKPLQE